MSLKLIFVLGLEQLTSNVSIGAEVTKAIG